MTDSSRCWPWRPHKWSRWEPATVRLMKDEKHVGDGYGQRRECLRCGREQVRRVQD